MNSERRHGDDLSAPTPQNPRTIPCERIQEVLFDYLSGELGDRQSWVVREHLRTCPACSREAARLEETVAILRRSRGVEPPATLPPTIRRRLARALLHPVLDWMYVHRRLTAWTIALATLAAILAIAYACRFRPETVIYWLR